MGLGEEHEPPKKKLKQAQLCFAPKSQKRKLVSDLDDECQIVKIVCKETGIDCDNVSVNDKENHLSVNSSLTSEKKVKHDLERGDVLKVENSTKASKHSSASGIDIVEENACMTSSDEKEAEKKPDSDTLNNSEFSLSISDSVIDSINQKSLSNDVQDQLQNVSIINGNSEKQPFAAVDGSDGKAESQSDSNKNIGSTTFSESNEDENNKTLNSEDDVVSLSSSYEESPEGKSNSSPSLQTKKVITPKRLESLKRKEERKRLNLEKKAQWAKIKEEKIRLQEEEKKKKKEEKELKRQAEQKLKEEEKRAKEEERKKKDEEKKQKEEERKKKEEGRRLKEEEKRKREEAREEEKRKKEEIEEKKKAAFAKFFRKSKLPDVTDQKSEENEENNFMPFPMKPDMRLANEPRRLLTSDEKECLEKHLSADPVGENCSYLSDIKSGKHIPLKGEETWPLSTLEEEHDVIIIESTENGDCVDLTNTKEVKETKNKIRAKLLQFHDNRRPPYWGTWRKSSKAVGPRKPFALDKVVFDYEVDSDSEWEDEGEGEDIEKEEGADTDGDQSDEEETAAENGYVLDNTFVPHGYLSDEEVHPDEDVEDNEPENQKLRMKLLKQEFDEEMKAKTERLKPRLLGCVWISNGTTEISSGSLYEGLMTYRAVWNEDEGSIDMTGPVVEDSPSMTIQTKKAFPQTVLSILAKFVHGSNLPMLALVKEFLLLIEKEHPSEHVSKRAVTLKIKDIATKTYDYSTGKPTWAVNATLCEELGLKPLSIGIPTPPPVPPTPSVVEKPKDNPLMNFLKGVQTPPVKKKVPFITLPSSTSFDYTPSKLSEGGVKNFGTPRPVDPVLKKRAHLITLSTSIDKNKGPSSRLSEGTEELKPTECIDLCDDSL